MENGLQCPLNERYRLITRIDSWVNILPKREVSQLPGSYALPMA